MMAFINVAEWTPDNVTDWLKGLDDCILPYVHFFLNNNINGCRLLLLSCDDLNHLNVRKVGHQELILEAVDLLKHLHYNFGSETLQALSLRLGCKARSLFNQLKQNQLSQNNDCDNYLNDERVSTPTLSAVSDILAAVKAFISWIDRYPFEGQDQYIPVRKTILRLSIELASTAQRDQFVEKPNDVIKKSCITLAELCDRIVQELIDSLAIQPAVLDMVTVKKKPDEELGMHIHSSYSGIHIVGGIKFQSPSHRCGRIEEGDEIIQVSYQTVVGWQLKKLVNSMKEHPTEILLTIKKRPRHSNIMGQVIVLKPYKIPSRKSGHRSNGSRVKNAATTTTGSGEDDDAFLPDGKHSKPVYQLYPRRPKLQVRRRATISGASPTLSQPPIRIEDLVVDMGNKKDKKESINRSISHDPSKYLKNLSRGLSADVSSTHVPFVVNNNNTNSNFNSNSINNNNNKPLSSSSPKLPYAKVHPFPMEGKPNPVIKKSENQTTPKNIIPSTHSLSLEKQQKSSNSNQNELAFIPHEEEQSLLENKKIGSTQVGVVNPSPVTVTSYKLINDIQPKPIQTNNKQKEQINKLLKSPLMNRSNFNCEPKTMLKSTQQCTPVLRSSSKTRIRHSTRRVSCRDLGEGDCQGWLYQRKEQHGFLGSSSRWIKRWVVLKSNYLYCYKDTNEAKAECLIHLPGFTVSPAPECKSKKYSFKLYNPNTAFHFASDSQIDMSKWMNKMGLAAISYMTHSDLQPEAFCYSETEESEDGSPSINRKRFLLTSKQSAIGYREASPAALSTSSSDTNNSIKEEFYGRSRIPSTSSSSTTSNSSSFHELLPKKSNKSNSLIGGSPTPQSPLIQNRINYVRSASCLDATDIIAARNRRQLLSDSSSTRYAKLVFPHSQSPKGSFSPQIPPRKLRIPVNSNFSADSGSLDRQRFNILKDIATGTVSKVANSYNSLQQDADTETNKRQVQPPRPLPRTSKLTNRRENVLPGFVAKMTDNFDHRIIPMDSTTPSIPNTPPTRQAPKPNEKLNAKQKDENKEQNDDTYEYVFRPTMAMIKTGIVNPLYDRVQNKSWSGEMHSMNSTGKGRMPLPNEIQEQSVEQNLDEKVSKTSNQSPNELSILDREYNRLYGVKKPNERLSPKIPVTPFIPKSATSVEIESLYTSTPRTTSSSSVGNANSDEIQCVSPSPRERPQTPSSDNSMSSSSGISSYYSTYLEIPAEQMYRMMNKRQTSTSSYHSAKSSPSESQSGKFDFIEKLNAQQTPPTLSIASVSHSNECSPENSIKPNKSPTKSSSFRLFSSPKLLKKLSTPKYHKERHLEKRDVNKLTTDEKPSKTGRLFLGSPKLTRAFFGSSSKKAQPLPQPLPQQKPIAIDSFDKKAMDNRTNEPLNTSHTNQTDTSYYSKHNLNRSSSDSSVTSNNTGLHHHIVEKKINKPQLTIALPLLTESSTDSSEMPLTPETPRKPTMGVSMIGKKRRPSNVGSDKGDIESALQQYYGSGSLTNPSTCSSRTDYTTEDTDDEWANIVRTIEETGLTLEGEKRSELKLNAFAKPIDDEKLCHLVLSLRALQRTLKQDKQQEIEAINDLLNQPISVDILENWIQKYPHLLPQEYY